MNGATQTFRRPSVATTPSYSRDSGQTPVSSSTSANSSGVYVPPHASINSQSGLRNGNGAASDNRYSKDQLLDIYKALRDSGILGENLSDYFVADWDPHLATSTANGGAWGKRDEQPQRNNQTGPEICWDHGGQMEPLCLFDMSDDEKEVCLTTHQLSAASADHLQFFSSSVNSPLKPPPASASKDSTGAGGRKASFSHSQNQLGSFNTPSSGGRVPPRRRETGDSATDTHSTGGGSRFFRDESAATATPSLLRRKTELANAKSAEDNGKDDAETTSPFGSLKRSSTNPLVAAGLTGSSSPWQSASHSASFSPMGAFGAFPIGSSGAQTPTSEKKANFGSLRGESRMKGLFAKDGSEDPLVKEKPSLSSLEHLTEDEGGTRSASPWGEAVKTRAGRSETNPFLEEPRSGSAALGGSQEDETALAQASAADPHGISAFGMTPSVPGFRELMQSHEESSGGGVASILGHEPTSPTTTNPYQSPHGDKPTDVDDVDTDGSDIQQAHHPGITGFRDPAGPFGPLRRIGSGVDLPSVDRSQTSSVGTNRGFPSLGGLGGLSGLGSSTGWPSGASAVGTPSRERPAFSTGFGDPIFGTLGDLQSPSLSGLGGGFFGPHTGTSSIGRSSKLGSLFPSAMQEQMQDDQMTPSLEDFLPAGELTTWITVYRADFFPKIK